MSRVGQIERETQNRLVKLLQVDLGYDYLGNWEKQYNSNLVESEYLAFQSSKGVGQDFAKRSFRELEKIASNGSIKLYQSNREFYEKLRYGVKITPELGEQNVTVWPIDWKDFEKNRFSFAQEVTVEGAHGNKRPDIVVYINGIAIAVIELKRSTVSIEEGILQHLDNQNEDFIESFFSTVQMLIAGNDTQGVKYGTVGTERNGYYYWNEEDSQYENKLDRGIKHLLSKERLIRIIHSFIAFSNGTKLICRSNQFHGVNELLDSVKKDESGIIWHTQGSGKSMTMVWGARAIREEIDNSRVLVVTDRDQLDEQIEGIFNGVKETIVRTKSGSDLFAKLADASIPVLCSLIQKFRGSKTDDESDKADVEAFVKELKSAVKDYAKPTGKFFVFIDEAHRTQSGSLHKYLKELLPDAIFIGFTGTPIFKNEKTLSIKIFGKIIHAYKYNEAVRDEVVHDIAYEARNVDKVVSDQSKIDAYFEAKTRNLNDIAKTDLKKKWASKQEVDSAKSRLGIIADDINLDMLTKPRLMTDRGNALLVASSIYEACVYFELLSSPTSDLRGKVGLVTSYKPNANDLKGQGVVATQYKTYTKMISEALRCSEKEAVNRTEEYIDLAKDQFVREPAQMKLLIVVDMLLTGFDAPSATYLYIDKPMKDHSLFQAVCRVNRIDPTGDDKTHGYIVDYRQLFSILKNSLIDYTVGAFANYDPDDLMGIFKPVGKEDKTELDDMIEATIRLLSPISDASKTEQNLRYFLTESSSNYEISARERLRVEFYKQVNAVVRTYSTLCGRESEAGYTDAEFVAIKNRIDNFVKIKDEISVASGDYIDLKLYEPDMRKLIDTYIRSNRSKVIADLSDRPLLELLATEGAKVIMDLPEGIRENPKAVAETITNNIRRTVIEKSPTNPKYFEKMSHLLNEVVLQLDQDSADYEALLKRLIALTDDVLNPKHNYPVEISRMGISAGAIYDQVNHDIGITEIANRILMDAQDGWRTNGMKSRILRNELMDSFKDQELVDKIIEVAKYYENY
ncbi:type I restriction enzyme, R subunit [Candidatus Planktophila dulcis]|uniref:Type I restriction enzyme endonuclease subunit n=1 Tax=Candidatus Planktophila dulcis TaxID=1884914 RepID=A0AAC9YSQ6_9ACTN|nr:HsdR family type I site-specific deoxyribonuclease [Candidatus Planktophila dulcis]ASY11821.1 type I restriction enzyme, R subunit [Candidatus Planktophila dulcis]